MSSCVDVVFAHEFLADSWDGELQHKRLIVHLAKSLLFPTGPLQTMIKHNYPTNHGNQIVSCIVSKFLPRYDTLQLQI